MSIVLEAVTMVADALGDDTIGVNAQLASVPRITGDTTVPADVAYIGDEFRDDRVNLRKPPPSVPAIYVVRDGPLVLKGEVATTYRDAKVPYPISIRIFTKHVNGAEDTRYNEYYGHAVMRCICDFLDNDSHAFRNRNSVHLIAADEMLWTPWREEVGQTIITGVVGLTLFMRDNAP